MSALVTRSLFTCALVSALAVDAVITIAA